MDLTCSLCDETVVGSAAVLGETPDFEGQMQWGELELYHGLRSDGSYSNYIVLHPICLYGILDELLRQEGHTAALLVLGSVPNVKDALGVP